MCDTKIKEFTTNVRQWYLQNGLQLNPNKSKALFIGMTNQMRVVTLSVSIVSVAGVDLPVVEEMKVLGVVLNRRLMFHKHVSGGGAIMQLPSTGHHAHLAPANYKNGTDAGV